MKSKSHNRQKNIIKIGCKKIITIFILLCITFSFAQNSSLDKKLEKIDPSALKSGILYDRTMQMANLNSYNMPSEKPHNTANYGFFIQALSEMHQGSNKKLFVSAEALEKKLQMYDYLPNIVPIGIINTSFQRLNYNPENPKEAGLIMNKDSVFESIEGKKPFLDGYAMVIAPLKNVVQAKEITYIFSEEWIFNNGDQKIKRLLANFGDGKEYKIIEEGKLAITGITVSNSEKEAKTLLNFSVEMENGFIFTTNGAIHTINAPSYNSLIDPMPPACSVTIPDTYGLIENFEPNRVETTDAFKGLDESEALKARIDARVFYHTKDRITGAENRAKTMMKPIIIIDGFDPSDKRRIDDCDCERDPSCRDLYKNKYTDAFMPDQHISFVEKMIYDPDGTQSTTFNLISILQAKGYDVILVNQPSYAIIDEANPTVTIWIPTIFSPFAPGHYVTVPNVKYHIDGGADFIERNAMGLITLIRKVNAKLAANGSPEKLVIMGPSMGGQISRYALAYMEKKFAETGDSKWQHNTRIWVAFDSPNHGANVSLGDQSLIRMFADSEVDQEAKKNLKRLQSAAAKEMLINYMTTNSDMDNLISNWHYYDLNLDGNSTSASTISQGMPVDRGNLYFQTHYNNQFNNGLPNSNGFPMNVRKLAVVNGSLTGETFGNGYEKIIDVNLSKQICLFDWNFWWGWHISSCFNSKLFQTESYTVPNSSNRIARTEKLRPSDANDTHIFKAACNDIRGNFDNIPGGSIDATKDLYEAITGTTVGPYSFWQDPIASASSFYAYHIGGGAQWETRAYKPIQSFIPTYSSIGIKNPNQSWSNPLDRNLVCSNETYFDSYFGEAKNTEHVSLNYRGVNWLLKELGTNTDPPSPQAPYFPIQAGILTGPDLICNSNSTYTFSDPCKLPSAVTWSVSPNLQMVASTNYSVTVKQITNGKGTITATFHNGQTVTKTIWVGKPSFTFEYTYYDIQPIKSTLCVVSDVPDFTLEQQGVTSVTFTGVRNFNANCIRTTSPYCKEATVTSACGTVKMKNDCVPFKQSANNTSAILDYYTLSPNPSNDVVTIALIDQNNLPEKGAVITGELFNMMGISQSKVEIKDNEATFSVKGLNHGIYVLKIYINDQVESHQIAVE